MVLVVGVFNYTVDPLNYVRANTNSYFSSERNLKLRMASERNYRGLIIGSSKASYIDTQKIGKPNSILNASFSAALPEEILYFLKARKSGEIWVAIGLDWYMFHEKIPFDVSDMFVTTSDIAKYLISARTVSYSIRTIYKRFLNRPYKYSDDGSRYVEGKQDCNSGMQGLHTSMNDEYQKVMIMLRDRFSDFKISKRRLKVLSEIESWGINNGVKIVWWINPYHQDVLSLLKSYKNSDIDDLPGMIENSVGKVFDLSERYPDKCNYWSNDPVHYRPDVGNTMFLENIFASIKEK